MGADQEQRQNQDGMRADSYGYNVPLKHFLGLLRSDQFCKLVDVARAYFVEKSLPPAAEGELSHSRKRGREQEGEEEEEEEEKRLREE